jgi:hypothetical protein
VYNFFPGIKEVSFPFNGFRMAAAEAGAGNFLPCEYKFPPENARREIIKINILLSFMTAKPNEKK